ncbi:hypothetical protein SKAU_G00156700 [Synaphobranchus kaupii]|uniref:Mitotic checkpoint serine/threonine-protein kinase BUB1 beta n=1 Tax=Synaphobranchus kaupii TaxID=118154 RepID=A0A9Q1IZC3_SYNKA|nr:hypothetical protein SKAU_G00156700 [Synaphobranchus kaupii]
MQKCHSVSVAMAEEGGAQWECKETNQPMKRAWVTSTFHRTLNQLQGSCTTTIQEQREAFESELQIYCGDDPLDVWDRYVRWTLRTFPRGGKESNLSVILERAVMHFADENKFYDDARYVNLWIKLAENSTEPLDVYGHMHAQRIGVLQAAFYVAWSEEQEKCGNYKKAGAIYQAAIKCGAEPFGELQQSYRNFHVRVSSQASSAAEDAGMDKLSAEPIGPHGTSLMNPELTGKKRAVAPQPPSVVLDSVSCNNRGVSLQQPPAAHNVQTNLMAVFDENQPGASCPEPFKRTSCTKENDLITERWTNSKGPQKFRFDHSAVVTSPKKKNFQPFIDDPDEPPEVSRPQYRSMYLKEALLLNSDTELCFEELRTLRYGKGMAQELEEKMQHLQRVKEELRLEIEEKQKLLQECNQQSGSRHQEPLGVLSKSRSAHSPPDPCGSALGLRVHCGSNSSSPPKLPFQDEDIYSGENALKPQADRSDSNVTQFTIFDESSTREPLQAMTSVPARSKLSRRPFAVVRKPLGGASLKGPGPVNYALGRTEHLHDYSTASANQNEMLFSSPESTSDCAPQMGSTPYRPHACAGSDLALSRHATVRQKELSPIQEASLEDLSGLSSLNASNPLNKLEPAWRNTHSADETNSTAETPTDVEMVDPCSLSVRRRLLEDVDLTSCLGLYKKPGPLPSIHEYDVLSPGDEPFLILSKVISSENHAVYLGKSQSSMIVQVDFQCVPWNFYIASRLRNRLTSDPLRRHSDQTSCFMYEDGCITVSQGGYTGTLREFLARSSLRRDGAGLLAIELVELVEEMHACHMVHGDLRPDTLLLRHRDECEGGSGVLKFLDFACCLDLELQPKVISCQGLPASQAYLRQGVLSPSSTPYQVDLLGIAETVHMMLKRGNLQLVEENSEWKLAGDQKDWESSPGDTDAAVWREFFRTLLNPGARSTVTVLSELRQDLRKHFAAGPEALTVFSL